MLRSLAIIAVCAVTVGGLLAPTFLDSASAGTTDLLLMERPCGAKGSYCRTIPNGAPGSLGDKFVFSVPLDSRSGDARVGREEGECITLQGATPRSYCDFVAHLDGGDVAAQGTLASITSRPSVFAVVGGTGTYEGATGYWHQSGRTVTLHLVIP